MRGEWEQERDTMGGESRDSCIAVVDLCASLHNVVRFAPKRQSVSCYMKIHILLLALCT